MSPDFKFNAPPTESASIGANYSFTGDNINKTLDTLKINTNLGTVNKVTGEANTFIGKSVTDTHVVIR